MMMMMPGMNVGAVIGNRLDRQPVYPYKFRRYLDDLKEQVEKLDDARRRLLQFVDEAERQGDEISPDVGKWLAHAEETIRRAEALIEDEMMTKKKCFNGLCPDLKSRYELSKKAMKLADDIVKIREANDFGGVSGTKPAPFRNYEASKSRNPISVVSIAAEYFAIPIWVQLGYLLQYKSNTAGLMEQVEKLANARQRVQVSVDEARGQGNEIFLDVQKWLIRAEEMIQKVEKLKEEEQSTNNRCFNGRYPNLMSRYQLSKEAKKLAGLLVKIIQETHNFDRVSFPPPPTGIWSATLESRMPISIASRPAEDLDVLIGGQLDYLLQYKSNIAGLMEQVEKLGNAWQRVQVSVDEARGQGNEIFLDVQKWLIRAEEMIQKVEKLKEEEQSTNNRCFNGRYPNLMSRYQLSKEAKKLAGLLVKIIQETHNFDRVSFPPPPTGIWSATLESRMPISIASRPAEDLDVLIGGQLDYLLQYKSNIAGLMEQVEKLGNAWQRVQVSVDEARGQGNEIFLDVQKWLIRAEEMIQKVEKLKEEEQSTNNRCFNGRYPNLMSRYQLSKEAKKLAGLLVKIIQETHNFDRVSFPPPPTGIWSATLESRMPISIASRPAEDLDVLIGDQLDYLLQYKSNIAGLMEQVEKLGNAWQRVQVSVEEARRQGNEIFLDVQKWLIRAEEMIRKAERFIEDETKTSKSCFRLNSMYKLSMEAKKQANDIAHEVYEGYRFDKVSYQLPPQGIGAERVQAYEALESRMWILNEIMDALRDDELNMIGIWGMVGVGKTILAEQVAIQAQENMLFDEVVRVQVPLTPSLMQIQEKIASMLGLRLEQENESLRAHRLYERLKKKNRILIILDGIWAELDLRKVGIPWGDDHPGCKIVLTSRDLFVLSNEMATQRNFRVQHLSEEEAWRLFEKTAGDSIEKPDLRSIAIEVAKECAGLPFAVVSIAKALKHEDPAMWKQTLQQLRRSIMTSIEEFSDKLYSTANLSYSHLNNDEIKSLLLLCGLIANDAGTDVLLEYVIGLALFEGVNTLEEATNRLQSLLHDLRSASLLLGCEDDKRVIMHGVLRDLAIEIASRERHWLVREDVPSEEWSKTDEIEIATEDDHWLAREGVRLEEWSKTDEAAECISLNLRHIHELPDERLECPKLKIFRLSCKDPYLEIRTNFFEFEGMKELQVLDLSGMHFLSLPSSLGFLQNLRTLRLHKCALKNISMISKLTKLEVLSLVHSNVSKFPREMAQLTGLRLLDLCNCSQLKEIPYNTISKFSQLEKLCMENSFTQWEVDGDHASVAELKFLSQLMILDVKIPDASLLPQGELLGNLMRFRIFIGYVWDWYGNYETSRTLKLDNFDTGLHLVDVISKLLKRTEDLCLRELNGTKNLLNLDREGFRELQYLHVQNSPEIQFIINSVDGLPADGAFPVLKSLLLDNLIRLEGVCHGRLPVGSFCNLRFLTIENCSSLLTVAPLNLLPGLQNLEVLDVRACNLLEEVFNFEGLDTHNVHVGRLPKLKELKLIDLPELKHICKKGLPRTEEITVQEGAEEAVEDFPELTSLSLESLPSLSSFYNLRRPGIPIPALFDERVALPSLEFLRISGLDRVKKIWHNQLLDNSFSNLEEMKVEYCKELRNVFSFHALQWLPSLRVLTTAYCDSIEEVFDLEGVNFLEDTTVTHLSYLGFNHLPKLKHIFNKDPHGFLTFPDLDLVEVFGCGRLKNLFPVSLDRNLLYFQKQLIRSRPVEEIAQEDGGVMSSYVFPEVVFDPVSNLQARKGKELLVDESNLY